jgi:hypothetical protein
MYIVVESIYPNDKAKEVTKVYVKMLTKYPDDASVNPTVLLVRGTFQGIKTINTQEVKKGKLDDALALTVNRMVMFHDIPGFRYAIKTYLSVEEAIKAIGM